MRLILATLGCLLALMAWVGAPLAATPALAQPLPVAPQASPSPTPTPAAVSPAASRGHQADPEGDSVVRLAIVVGVGLIGTVVLLLIVGALARRRYRRPEDPEDE